MMSPIQIGLSVVLILCCIVVSACTLSSKVKKQSELSTSPLTQSRRHSIWSAADIFVRRVLMAAFIVLPIFIFILNAV